MAIFSNFDVDIAHVVTKLLELFDLLFDIFTKTIRNLDITSVDVDFHDISLQSVGVMHRTRLSSIPGARP